MKRLMTAAYLVCAMGFVGLSAAQADKMDNGMKSASVTGCVAEKDGHYMLTNAMMMDVKGQMRSDMKPMTIDLMGGDMKAHRGHQVEVTGMMDPKMMEPKMADPKMTDKEKMAMADMHGAMNVKSVKMVSTSCK